MTPDPLSVESVRTSATGVAKRDGCTSTCIAMVTILQSLLPGQLPYHPKVSWSSFKSYPAVTGVLRWYVIVIAAYYYCSRCYELVDVVLEVYTWTFGLSPSEYCRRHDTLTSQRHRVMICQGFYQAHSRHSPVWSTAARIECNMTSAAVNDRLWFVYLGVHYQKRYSWWMVAAYRPHTEVRRSEQLMAQPQQQNRWTKLTVIQIEWIYHETKQLEIAKQTAQRFHQIPYRRYWLSISCHQQMPSQELYFWQPRTCIKAQIMHVMSSTASRQLSIHIDIVLFTPSARDNPFCWCRGCCTG